MLQIYDEKACGLFELLLEAKVPVFQIPVSASPFPSPPAYSMGSDAAFAGYAHPLHPRQQARVQYTLCCSRITPTHVTLYVVSTPLCPFSGMCRQG